jgi:hypothetical protein
LKVLEYLAGLGFDVALAHKISLLVYRGLSGDVNLVSDLHHLGKSGSRVPESFWLHDVPRHFSSLE